MNILSVRLSVQGRIKTSVARGYEAESAENRGVAGGETSAPRIWRWDRGRGHAVPIDLRVWECPFTHF